MEMWARYAHKDLWHDFEPGWALHKSHHMPRTGPFEANDVFAIINGETAALNSIALYLQSHPYVPAKPGPVMALSESNPCPCFIHAGVPAMALCLYGFLTPGITGGLAFGAGMGITLFGIMYMVGGCLSLLMLACAGIEGGLSRACASSCTAEATASKAPHAAALPTSFSTACSLCTTAWFTSASLWAPLLSCPT